MSDVVLARLDKMERKLDQVINREKCPGCNTITDGVTCSGCGARREEDGTWRVPITPNLPDPTPSPVREVVPNLTPGDPHPPVELPDGAEGVDAEPDWFDEL